MELFEGAVNWKNYFSSFFKPYIKGDVAEVGAGIGSTARYLINENVKSYTCIEPDPNQANVIQEKIVSGKLPARCIVKKGILESNVKEYYDAIIYIDVIEHIKDDKEELEKAGNALKSGGFLCILVPANPSDYSPFDKALGHFRRYNKKMLTSVIPSPLQTEWCKYLDICGSLSSKLNKYILKQEYPTKSQIMTWDKLMIPFSKVLDRITFHQFGKSLLLVAKKK